MKLFYWFIDVALNTFLKENLVDYVTVMMCIVDKNKPRAGKKKKRYFCFMNLNFTAFYF